MSNIGFHRAAAAAGTGVVGMILLAGPASAMLPDPQQHSQVLSARQANMRSMIDDVRAQQDRPAGQHVYTKDGRIAAVTPTLNTGSAVDEYVRSQHGTAWEGQTQPTPAPHDDAPFPYLQVGLGSAAAAALLGGVAARRRFHAVARPA